MPPMPTPPPSAPAPTPSAPRERRLGEGVSPWEPWPFAVDRCGDRGVGGVVPPPRPWVRALGVSVAAWLGDWGTAPGNARPRLRPRAAADGASHADHATHAERSRDRIQLEWPSLSNRLALGARALELAQRVIASRSVREARVRAQPWPSEACVTLGSWSCPLSRSAFLRELVRGEPWRGRGV